MHVAHPYANFLEALKQIGSTEAEQARVLGIPIRTLRNYKSPRRMPFQIKRLMETPSVMHALAADAEALAAQKTVPADQPTTPDSVGEGA